MGAAKNWDKVFKKGHFIYDYKPKSGIVKLVPLLKKKKVSRVLDLGCGAGRHLLYLSKKGFFVIGLDNSSEALKLSDSLMRKKKIKNYSLINSDMTVLPFPSSHFDAVISTNTIHHNTIQNIKLCIKEIYRILRRGAIAYITLISEADYKNYREECHATKIGTRTYVIKGHREPGVTHHFFTKKEAERLFSKFKIINLKEIVIRSRDEDSKIRKHAHWEILAMKV